MRTTQFYALLYPCGLHCKYANTGRPVATAYRFNTKRERDAACNLYTAPTHQPDACLVRATASNPIVRRALREPCGVLEWETA